MYAYNPQAQGFGMNPGGVPNGNIPYIPDVGAHPRVLPHMYSLANALYNEMANRGSPVTNYVANDYSKNGFNSELFKEALQIASEYLDYQLTIIGQNPMDAIPMVAKEVNDGIILQYINQAPNAKAMTTPVEKAQLNATENKLRQIRPKIREFLNMYKNAPQQMNPFQMGMQTNNGMQRQMSIGELRQMEAMQQQAMMQQQMNPYMQYQQPMYPNNGFMPNANMGMSMQNTNAWQPPANTAGRWQGTPIPGQPMYPNGQNPMGMGMQQPMQPMYPQHMNPGAMAANSNAIQNAIMGQPMQNQNPFGQPNMGIHQQYPQQQYPQGSPLVAVQAGTPLGALQPGDKRANIPGYMANRGLAPTPSALVNKDTPWQQANDFNKPQPIVRPTDTGDWNIYNISRKPPKQPMDDKAVAEIVICDNWKLSSREHFMMRTKIRSMSMKERYDKIANRLIQYKFNPDDVYRFKYEDLAKALSRLEPNNPYVYEQARTEYENYVAEENRKAMTHVQRQVPNNMALDLNNSNPFLNLNADNQRVPHQDDFEVYMKQEDTPENFAAYVRKEVNKSKGELIKDENGRYVWLSEKQLAERANNPNYHVNAFTQNTPNQGKAPPYPFARLNVKGDWIVNSEDFNKIKHKTVPYEIGCGGLHEVKYVVDDKGVLESYFIVPVNHVEDTMDYIKHDCRHFFDPKTKEDEKTDPDHRKTMETFSSIQAALKVEEVLAELDELANVENPDEEVVITGETIELAKQVNGDISNDNYWVRAMTGLSEELPADKLDKVQDVNIRYKHVSMKPWLVHGEDAVAVNKLKTATSYADLVSTLEELVSSKSIPYACFTDLNTMATSYINYILKTHFTGIDFYIKSFVLDVLDAQAEMDKLGHGEAFAKTYKKLLNTVLHVYSVDNGVFMAYHNIEADDNTDSGNKAHGFGIVRDVTVLNMTAAELSLKTKSNRFVLSKDGYSSLWEVAKDRFENGYPHALEVLLVTEDNRIMYIHETANPEIYVVTHQSALDYNI